jgi:hypothetical protein
MSHTETTHSDALGADHRDRVAGVRRMSAAVLLTGRRKQGLPPHGPHRLPDPLAREYFATGALLDGSAVKNFGNVSVLSDKKDKMGDSRWNLSRDWCLNLRWKDIDLDGKKIIITGSTAAIRGEHVSGTTKSGRAAEGGRLLARDQPRARVHDRMGQAYLSPIPPHHS